MDIYEHDNGLWIVLNSSDEPAFITYETLSIMPDGNDYIGFKSNFIYYGDVQLDIYEEFNVIHINYNGYIVGKDGKGFMKIKNEIEMMYVLFGDMGSIPRTTLFRRGGIKNARSVIY